MPAKGYWIAQLKVYDPEAHRIYVAASSAAIAAFGGRFLVRGGASEQVEGLGAPRQVIVEFQSYLQAKACYHSAEYKGARLLRKKTAEVDLVIVEGTPDQ
jgi:uncharacterized protein (DUF1330 family)